MHAARILPIPTKKCRLSPALIHEEPVPRRKVRIMTTELFLDAARRGDKNAAAALLARYEGLCRKAAGQAHLAPLGEDALSAARESFLCAVRDYDPARGVPFPGFAKAKVYGDLRTLFKKARRQWQREIFPAETETGENPFAALPDPRDDTVRVEADDAFRAMLAPLGEKPRRLLTMLYADGLTQKEAAARLGMSQQTAAVVKGRALKRLRETMKTA